LDSPDSPASLSSSSRDEGEAGMSMAVRGPARLHFSKTTGRRSYTTPRTLRRSHLPCPVVTLLFQVAVIPRTRPRLEGIKVPLSFSISRRPSVTILDNRKFTTHMESRPDGRFPYTQFLASSCFICSQALKPLLSALFCFVCVFKISLFNVPSFRFPRFRPSMD
jgi:hypothetical protein